MLAYLTVAVIGGTSAWAQNVQHISAIVNDEVISAFDVEQRLRLVLTAAQVPDSLEARRRLRTQVLRRLVDEKLQMQEARRLQIGVTSSEIQDAMSLVAEQSKIPVNQLPSFLAAQNISFDTLLAQIRADIIWSKLVGRRYRFALLVSDEEVEEVITRLNADKGKPEFLISEVFLVVSMPEEDEEVRRNALRLVEEARRGAPFAALARQFSQAGTASEGGEVGWVQPGQLAPELESVLAGMEIGEISEPIRAEGGYYILRLRERRKILESDPGDTRLSLKQILLPKDIGAGADSATSHRELAATLAAKLEGCDKFESTAKDLELPGSGDLGKVRLGDLPADLQRAVASLEIGKASQPVERPTGIHILMVCERTTPGSTTLDPDAIRDALVRQRLTLMSRRYLRDLRRDASVELR